MGQSNSLAIGTFFMLSVLFSIFTLAFFYVFVLFYSCCSHVKVFGRTLVHEFHIFYSHTEWYVRQNNIFLAEALPIKK